MSSYDLDRLRRRAKALRKSYEERDPVTADRLRRRLGHDPRGHTDYLHVVALEEGFASWPRLKWAADSLGLDRAQRLDQLRQAIRAGHDWKAEALLAETPDLAADQVDLMVAMYDRAGLAAALGRDPEVATRPVEGAAPLVHLCFSRWIRAHPRREGDMLAMAARLRAHGADVNDALAGAEGRLSVLYGALAHVGNLALAGWLLDAGADPNDGESLYHATEARGIGALRLLLAHGARPRGTNALLRALDFDDAEAVCLLLDAGADPDEPGTVPALHQAARRMCGPAVVARLLEAGADPARVWEGIAPHAFALAVGNEAMAALLAERGLARELTRDEALLTAAARGAAPERAWLNPDALPPACRNLVRELVHLPDRLPQLRALVAMGMEYDRPDASGVTPVQAAGWQGLPETMGWLVGLRPDLGHVNAHGGTLLGAILHGAEHAPPTPGQDHPACLRIALEHGVSLPREAIRAAGREDVAALLSDWAEAHPSQVI